MKKCFENFTFFTFPLHFKSLPNASRNCANGYCRQFTKCRATNRIPPMGYQGQGSILGPIIMSHRIYINCHILKSIIIILKSIIIAKQTHCFPKGSALLPSRNDILFVLIIDGKTVCVYYRHTFQRMSVISH